MKKKFSLTALSLLCAALISPALAADDISLAKCPAAVQSTIRDHAKNGKIDDVKAVTVDGRTLYIGDVDFTNDDDLKVFVAEDGTLVKTRQDVRLSSIPDAVQAAVKKMVPQGGQAEDVDKEISGGKTTYLVEIDRPKSPDLKVVFAEDGSVLSQQEDQND